MPNTYVLTANDAAIIKMSVRAQRVTHSM